MQILIVLKPPAIPAIIDGEGIDLVIEAAAGQGHESMFAESVIGRRVADRTAAPDPPPAPYLLIGPDSLLDAAGNA